MDSIAYAIGHGNKIPDGYGDYVREGNRLVYEDKTEEQLIMAARVVMHEILSKCKCSHYLGYIKGKNCGKFRYDANPDYKSNRPKERPKWWDFVSSYLVENYNVFVVNDIEVDDAVNITYNSIEDGLRVAIDKDLLNLEGHNYNWKTDTFFLNSKEFATECFWFDMVVGQPGDGIKGIPGKGKVFAKKLTLTPENILSEYITHFGEPEGVKQFYRNYVSFKMLDALEGFEIPPFIEIKKKITWDEWMLDVE